VTAGPTIVGVIAATTAAVALTAGCGPDGSAERPYQPTLPAVDFRPVLVLTVGDGDDGVRAAPGERAVPVVRTDPPTVPSGSVVEVRNAGSRDRRLRAGTAFDTGIMRPGERTTVVVTSPGSDRSDLDLVDELSGRPQGRLAVEPPGS
jgi:hypothetical protein